jgi:OFA family oxalate/formate antiporter-like MFS transporter
VLLTVLAISVAAPILLWQTDVYALVVVGIFAVGLCYGGFLALMGPITSETFGPKGFAVNFGIMYLTMAVASYVGPRLAAAVAEANGGDYKQAFLIAAALALTGLALATAHLLLARRRSSARPVPPEAL